MIANCKQARHGEEIGDYNEEKKVNGVYVATEIFRNNVFGIDAKECVKEMREAQEQSGHKLKNGFFRIEITPSKEEQAMEWTEEQWQSVITDYSSAWASAIHRPSGSITAGRTTMSSFRMFTDW